MASTFSRCGQRGPKYGNFYGLHVSFGPGGGEGRFAVFAGRLGSPRPVGQCEYLLGNERIWKCCGRCVVNVYLAQWCRERDW
jgi:hypothetical protein